MHRILFVCHGNICRSPMAEFYMKRLVKRAGLEKDFYIESAATRTDAIGEQVYPPAKAKLAAHGIDCSGKRARLMERADYERFELLIGMDEANLRDMTRISGGDPSGKIKGLTEYAGRPGESVADPWYTGDFDSTWRDVSAGCQGLFLKLTGICCLDFSACTDKNGLYGVLREKMDFEDWYGNNLDALYDVLTGLPHKFRRFLIIRPERGSQELMQYTDKLCRVFSEAGARIY